MLKLIKRLVGIEEPLPQHRPVKRPARKPSFGALSAPAPLPNVVEGNEQSDWDLWQDSVNSQLNSSFGPVSQQPADTQSSQLDDLDPFVRVGKNRDA